MERNLNPSQIGAASAMNDGARDAYVAMLVEALSGCSSREAAEKSTVRSEFNSGYVKTYLTARGTKPSESAVKAILAKGRAKDAPELHKKAISGALMSRVWNAALSVKWPKESGPNPNKGKDITVKALQEKLAKAEKALEKAEREVDEAVAQKGDPVAVIEDTFAGDADVIIWLSDQTGEVYAKAIAALRQMMTPAKGRKSLKAA